MDNAIAARSPTRRKSCRVPSMSITARLPDPDTVGFRANIQAPAPGFHLLSGHPRRYIKTADSGARWCMHSAKVAAPSIHAIQSTRSPIRCAWRLRTGVICLAVRAGKSGPNGDCHGCRSSKPCQKSKASPERARHRGEHEHYGVYPVPYRRCRVLARIAGS
jgi:hypothetical protein